MALWGPDGAGKSTAVDDLARLARAHGFIPIAARFITSAYAELWRGRHLLIVEEDAETIDIRGLLHGVLQTAHAHVLIITMCEEARGLDAIRLDRVDPGRLIAAVDPPASDAGAIEHLRRAAAGARGLPGRFVRAIQPQTSLRRSRPAGLPRAAEPEATFAAADQLETTRPSSDTTGTWPAPGELAALRRRMEAAVADARAGRHSRAVRLLRQSVGALARRGDWVSAGEGSAALAETLLGRGRPREALATLEQARHFAVRSGVEPALVDVAVLAGAARIDLARLDEAESILGAAVSAAGTSGDGIRTAAARILARAVRRGCGRAGRVTRGDRLADRAACPASPAERQSRRRPRRIQSGLVADRRRHEPGQRRPVAGSSGPFNHCIRASRHWRS